MFARYFFLFFMLFCWFIMFFFFFCALLDRIDNIFNKEYWIEFPFDQVAWQQLNLNCLRELSTQIPKEIQFVEQIIVKLFFKLFFIFLSFLFQFYLTHDLFVS